jgi:hypothetical protein
MAKRIKISISNKKRPNLSLLFHEYIQRKATERSYGRVIDYDYDDEDYEDMAAYWDKAFPGWDDDIDYNGPDTIFPIVCDTFGLNKGKRGKRGKHKHTKGKKGRKFDIDVPYSGFEDNPTEYWGDDDYEDGDGQSKTIWFYPDYHDKDDKLEFNSLKAFDKYCTKMGYKVPKYVESDIVYRSESHCCLNPQAEREGVLEIMAEHSYGEMFYEACDTDELSGYN